MKKATTQQIKAYKLDMSQTKEDGSFPCPNCGIRISPDDRSDSKYIVYDSKMKDDNLSEIVISCKRCLALTHLIIKKEIVQIADAEEELLYFSHV